MGDTTQRCSLTEQDDGQFILDLEHGDVLLSDILTSFLVIGVGFEHRRKENMAVIQR